MLKPKLNPTPLIEEQEAPIPIITPKDAKHRGIRIWYHIAHWLIDVLRMKLTGRWTAEINAVRTRQLMERLGFLWIKVGQLLSLREDFFSAAFCKELSNLQYRVHGFPPEIARQTIEEELGGPVEQFFDDFEDHPFAAASIAQVHRARLKREGVDVIVKVMRPDAVRLFEIDMKFFRFVVGMLDRVPSLKWWRFEEGLWELERIVSEEIDYRYEVSNIRRFRKNMRKHKNIYVPKPFTKYCTDRVLVMERIEGTLMSDYLKARKDDPNRVAQWRQENNIRPKRVAKHLIFSFMRQMFEDNVFHGDLHPGNILLLRDDNVALIDLGSLGTLERQFLRLYYFFMKAAAVGEYEKAADLFLAFMPELPPIDIADLRQDMVRTFRAWEARTHLKKLAYHQKSVFSVSTNLMEVVSKYRITMTWGTTRADRTFVTLDATLNDLIPTANYPKLFDQYFAKQGQRTLRKMFSAKTLRSTLTDLPDQIAETQIFIDPLVRRIGQAFAGDISKLSRLMAFAFRTAARAMVLTAEFLIIVLLHQEGLILTGVYSEENVRWALQRWVAPMPYLAVLEWGMLIVLAFGLCLLLYRLGTKFAQVEVQLPFTNKAL